MDRQMATHLLGEGNEKVAAEWMRLSPRVYHRWPERLHHVMVDRVIAAIFRKEYATTFGLSAEQFFAEHRTHDARLVSLLVRVSLAAVMAHVMGRIPPELDRHPTHDEDGFILLKPSPTDKEILAGVQ